MNPQKSTLIVLSKPPYKGQMARESLDVILTAAAFETPLSVLFTGDGVYQLLNNQQASSIKAKDMSASLPVLPLYDVKNLFVDEESMLTRGLNITDCILAVESLGLIDVQALFSENDRVLSF